MTLEEILDPIVDATTWTFDNLLLPLAEGNRFNAVVVVLIVAGIAYWLKLQSDYNKKADVEGKVR